MTAEVDYPGQVKLDFCRRLGDDWRDLADLLEVPPHVARGFVRGDEARGVWEWLLARGGLGGLPSALHGIGREDLAHVFDGRARTVAAAPSPGNRANVPGLPSRYLERGELIARLRDRLLASGPGGPSNAPLIMITGMAGVGKSVTARALARDPAVVEHFGDGVAWLELGKRPDIQTRQNQLIEALGGVAGTSVDQQQANVRLNDLVRGKSFLLVLDDAWDPEHLRAFEIHHPTVTLLVTTRDRELLHTENTEELVDALDERSALSLFARHLDVAPGDLTEDELGIVEECAGLPLALAVAGGIVAGRRWYAEGLLHRLRFGRVDQFDIRLRDYPYPSLLKALDASIVELSPAQLACCLSLAVFRNAGSVPRAAFGHLWASQGLSRYEVQDMLVALDRRSLLSLDPDTDRVSVHGLLYDYIALCVDPAELRRHHRDLAHSYLGHWGGLQEFLKDLRADGEPDEGQRYGIAHIVFHLAEGGCAQEMHRLLALSVPPGAAGGTGADGANLWYSLRNALHQGEGYLDDVRIAWDSVGSGPVAPGADAESGAPAFEPNVALRLRYALITASIRSIAAQISPRLLSRMADTGAWPGDRCLHHALRIPQADARTEALATLLPHLCEPDVKGAVTEIVAGLPHVKKTHRARTLALVAARLSPEHTPVVLGLLDDMRSPPHFADVVEALLPALTEPLARKALEGSERFRHKPYGAWARALLATCLPAAERVGLQLQCLFESSFGGAQQHRETAGKAIRDVLGEGVDEERVLDVFARVSADAKPVKKVVLAGVALPLLSGSRHRTLLEQARTWAAAVPGPADRCLGLSLLAGVASGDARAALADAALAAAAEVRDPTAGSSALVAAALAGTDPTAVEAALEASIDAAKRSRNRPPTAFLTLCPRLPDALLDRALEAAGAMGFWRGRAYAALAPRLTADRLGAVLRLARRNTWSAKQLIPAVFAFLPPPLRLEAVSVIAELDPPADRAELLQTVAAHLDPATAQSALPSALALRDRSLRFATLAALVPQAPPAVRHAAMEDVVGEWEAGAGDGQTRWIDLLCEHLDKRQLERMSARIETLRDIHLAVSAVTALLPYGDLGERRSLIRSATGPARRVSDPGARVRALIGLARRVPRKDRDDLLTQALEALGHVTSPAARLEHVFAVLSAAPPAHGPAAARLALSALPLTDDAEVRGQAAAALVSPALRESGLVPEEDLPALTAYTERAATRPTASVRSYTRVFTLSGPPLGKLAFALAAEEEDARSASLVAVAPHLPPALREEAVAGARLLTDKALRAHTLDGIADAAEGEHRRALLSEAWDVRLSVEDRSADVRVAAAFLPLAPHDALLPVGHCLVQEAHALDGSLARCRAVTALAEVLPPTLAGRAAAVAHRVSDPVMRTSAVTAVCKRLPAGVARRTVAGVVTAVVETYDATVAARALASASAVLDEEDRTRLGLGVLEAVSRLGSGALRAVSYRELARVRSEPVTQALLERSRKLDPPDRAVVVAALAEHCGPAERRFALSQLGGVADARGRAAAARALIAHIGDEDAGDGAGFFDVIAGLGDWSYLQATLLGALASHGSPQVRTRALEAALGLPRIAPRVSAVMTIAPLMCEEAELARWESEFLSLCARTKNHGERAGALVELSRFARGRDRERIVVEAVVTCLTLAGARRRADLARTVGRVLAGLRTEDKGSLLDRCLRAATAEGRSAIVSCLPVLVPLLLSAHADGTVRGGHEAVEDVFRWWT
ncbi:NB-ARC domain-containing protein [Streptomyces sp. NPDC088812]|uniref:NB-ARC domain-containing protein n=1 Tax=Streptomyces sp. NPDC088812 TaxID=3365905 RepID=UPI00382583C8